MSETGVCAYAPCSKPFPMPEAWSTRKRYCSVPCAAKALGIKRRRVYPSKICPVCGKEYHPGRFQAQRHCSHACAAKRRHQEIEDKRERRLCLSCERRFIVPHNVPNKRYCTPACFNAARAVKPPKAKDGDFARCCGRKIENSDFTFDRLGRTIFECPVCGPHYLVDPRRKTA